MKRHAGFSLIELMIVVTIAGTLAAFAMPALQDWNRNAARSAAVTNFLSSAHLARSEAVKRNQRVQICPANDPAAINATCTGDTNFATGWIVFVDEDKDLEHATAEEIVGAVDAINANFTIISTQGQTSFYFTPSGRMVADDGANVADFNICDDRGAEQGRVVSITNSGRPQSGLTAADGSRPQC